MNSPATVTPGTILETAQPAQQQVYFFIRWSLYLYLVVVPLENIDPLGFANVFSLTKMAGYLLAILAITQPKLTLARPPAACLWLMAYLAITVLLGIFISPDEFEMTLGTAMTNAQNLIMFWLCCNLLRDDKIVIRAILAMAVGVFILVAAVYAGVGEQNYGDRIAGLGMEPNMIGYFLVIATLCLLGLGFGRNRTIGIWRHALWLPILLFVATTVRTGSRGAMLGLLAGGVVFSLRAGSLGTRAKALLLGGIVLVAGGYMIVSDEAASQRWNATLESGDTAGRTLIVQESWQMFCEKPIIGWGPSKSLQLLAMRLHSRNAVRDTHNILLWAMIGTGVVGTIPFVIGLGLCVVMAWKGRKGPEGSLPLTLMAAVLAASMSINTINRKITWVALGYIAASTPLVASYDSFRNPRREPPVGLR